MNRYAYLLDVAGLAGINGAATDPSTGASRDVVLHVFRSA
jgi:hypothetical protein